MFLHAPELQWESRLNEYIEMTRSKVLPLGASRDIVCVGKCLEIVRFNTRSILGGKSRIRTIDVGLLWMSSTKRLGASVDEFRYANRLVMFKALPVGNPQCSQLPSMKSI
ncbi:hypothetical protein CTI12_AA102280 [Artemisia annua]|uniref:Uncharacterized protein n=1 Tax=Artemisia annua TaxID=35608 RepID=A0A2U1PWL5_ARTAN|nr:hypothetical protein CTI12_AA102280 [Artemisia annua]